MPSSWVSEYLATLRKSLDSIQLAPETRRPIWPLCDNLLSLLLMLQHQDTSHQMRRDPVSPRTCKFLERAHTRSPTVARGTSGLNKTKPKPFIYPRGLCNFLFLYHWTQAGLRDSIRTCFCFIGALWVLGSLCKVQVSKGQISCKSEISSLI